MQLHIWKQNSEKTLDNFRKKYCVMLDPQIHDENSKSTLRSPQGSYYLQGKLQSPFQALPRPWRSGACLFYNLCSHQAASQVTNQSSSTPCPLAVTQPQSRQSQNTPGMLTSESLTWHFYPVGMFLVSRIMWLSLSTVPSLFSQSVSNRLSLLLQRQETLKKKAL